MIVHFLCLVCSLFCAAFFGDIYPNQKPEDAVLREGRKFYNLTARNINKITKYMRDNGLSFTHVGLFENQKDDYILHYNGSLHLMKNSGFVPYFTLLEWIPTLKKPGTISKDLKTFEASTTINNEMEEYLPLLKVYRVLKNIKDYKDGPISFFKKKQNYFALVDTENPDKEAFNIRNPSNKRDNISQGLYKTYQPINKEVNETLKKNLNNEKEKNEKIFRGFGSYNGTKYPKIKLPVLIFGPRFPLINSLPKPGFVEPEVETPEENVDV